MRKIIILALILAACSETEIEKCTDLFSDANPVKFWPIDCDTYNEKSSCGIRSKCYIHKWRCDVPFRFQFSSTENSNYVLKGYSNESLVYNEPINKFTPSVVEGNIFNGTWLWSQSSDGVPSVVKQHDWETLYSIFDPAGVKVTFSTFTSPFLASGSKYKTFDLSVYDLSSFTTIPISFYASMLKGNVPVPTLQGRIRIQLLSGVDVTYEQDIILSVPTTQYTLNIPITGTPTMIRFMALGTSDVYTVNVTSFRTNFPVFEKTYIYSGDLIPEEEGLCESKVNFIIEKDGVPVLKTDDYHFTNQGCFTVFEYWNNRNAFGIWYDLPISPSVKFYLPITSIFFHESFEGIDNAIDLISTTVKTSSELKSKRQLEIDYAPYYIHRTIQYMLNHSSILADNISWVKENEYEILEISDRTYPFKKAFVLLTESDSVIRNVL